MTTPIIQASALDTIIKAGPIVIFGAIALWFMEIQDARKDELVLKLLDQQTHRIHRLESFVRQCLQVVDTQTGAKMLPPDFGKPSE